MIEYKKGNLLDVTEGIIMHGCNCQGVMGSGVALAVKRKYPLAFDRYSQMCADFKDDGIEGKLLGTVQSVKVQSEPQLFIANAFTQLKFGTDKRHVSYDAVDSCFKHISIYCDDFTLHVPKIGAGLGGGKWEIIEAIINTRVKTKVICWEL